MRCSAQDINGKEVKFADKFAGKVVLVRARVLDIAPLLRVLTQAPLRVRR